MFFQHKKQCDKTNETTFLTCKMPNFVGVVLKTFERTVHK